MTEEIYIDGVNVSGCDRHCSDNYNVQNRCYSDINESYRDCKPKEYQCNFYVTRLEQENKQMKSTLEEIRILATKNISIENFVKIQNKINGVLGC